MTERGTIQLRDVTKSFRAYHSRSLKETLFRLARGLPVSERRPVLKELNLSVARGERLGIVGKNGAGKSTLFRVISKILEVDSGAVEVGGRISPLIEITASHVPDLTGAENIRLNAVLLGLSRRQIDERFDAIVEFAGLGDFVDTPTRFYSSGMQARLGFAVGVHVDADALLVDEALSVGDVDFQQRCVTKMHQLANAGTTVVVVSHDEALVRSFCSRVVVMQDGRVHPA